LDHARRRVVAHTNQTAHRHEHRDAHADEHVRAQPRGLARMLALNADHGARDQRGE